VAVLTVVMITDEETVPLGNSLGSSSHGLRLTAVSAGLDCCYTRLTASRPILSYSAVH